VLALYPRPARPVAKVDDRGTLIAIVSKSISPGTFGPLSIFDFFQAPEPRTTEGFRATDIASATPQF
jgi:hypothetical protein